METSGGRLFRGEVLCRNDVDPEGAAMYAVSKFVSQGES
jgi:hypothetical protein